MKKFIAALLAVLLLTGCGSRSAPEAPGRNMKTVEITAPKTAEIPYTSRFSNVTEITLSDKKIRVKPEDKSAVYTGNDITYYEDRDSYDSGNPYGEGSSQERHTAKEAESHTVINIVKPGAYRITGKLTAGQIRVDLGSDAYEDEDAVVELILDDADITSTVAPAIVFLNTYECDSNWSKDTARADVDTSAAGAKLILEGSNTVTGSHVAKIYRDQEGEKKLWKQDGAIYSYMSMNIYGPGSLEVNADNEGIDTELHLTMNGGSVTVYSGNDGINTNEDGVSVTTVNAGNLTIFAGLGQEGDGIDSNGYLVINGGNVVASANPAADAGLDSDLGSFIHGGTVLAMGSPMDWAESDSRQVTMNLQFAQAQKAGSKITVLTEDSTGSITFDTEGRYARSFSGMILSHPGLTQGDTYFVYVDDQQMAYTGTDAMSGPGGMGPGGMGPGGMGPQSGDMPGGSQAPEDWEPSQSPNNSSQEGITLSFLSSKTLVPTSGMGGMGGMGGMMPPGFYNDDSGSSGGSDNQYSYGPGGMGPGGMMPFGPGSFPGGGMMPYGSDSNQGESQEDELPDDFSSDQFQNGGMPGFFGPGGQMPGNSDSGQSQDGQMPGIFGPGQSQDGQMPGNSGPGQQNGNSGTPQTGFYMKDKVNTFSGVRIA